MFGHEDSLPRLQDEKKDSDVEMKGADNSTSRHGDVSPISLAEGPPKSRKSEPASERLSNFARVTPAQIAYISFSQDNRYQPVRVVSTRPPPSKTPKNPASVATMTERYAGGGGILIMADTRPEEEAEYIEFETQPVAQPAPGGGAPQNPPPTTPGRHIALDESAAEADPGRTMQFACWTTSRESPIRSNSGSPDDCAACSASRRAIHSASLLVPQPRSSKK